MFTAFVVTGMDFNPNECTEHFGLKPTQVLIEGESRPGIKRLTPQSSWNIETKKVRLDSTDTAVQMLTAIIWPRRKQIRDFARKNKLNITFVLMMTGGLGKRNYLTEFSPRTIEQIRYFRAPLYMDVY